MPDLLVLISTLGGLFYFGAVGFVVGPIVAALFIAVWEIYGRAFASYLPPVALPALSGVVELDGLEAGSRTRGTPEELE